jgi:hypothetical protein
VLSTLQQDKHCKRQPIGACGGLVVRYRLLNAINERDDFGPCEPGIRIVVGSMALLLHGNKHVGELRDFRRKVQVHHLSAGAFRKAMVKRAVNVPPTRIGAGRAGPHKKVRALRGKKMKKRIVCSADGAFEIGLSWSIRRTR